MTPIWAGRESKWIHKTVSPPDTWLVISEEGAVTQDGASTAVFRTPPVAPAYMAICSSGSTDGHRHAGLGKGDFLVLMFQQMDFSSTIQVATLSKQQLGKLTDVTGYTNDLL